MADTKGTNTNKRGKNGKRKRAGSEAKLLITTLTVSSVLTGWASLAHTVTAQPPAGGVQAAAQTRPAPAAPASADSTAPATSTPPSAGVPALPGTSTPAPTSTTHSTRRAQAARATTRPTATPVPAPVVITQSSR